MKSTQFHILGLVRWQCSVKWSVLRERQVMNLSAVTLDNREVQCPLWPAYTLSQAVGETINAIYLLWQLRHALGGSCSGQCSMIWGGRH